MIVLATVTGTLATLAVVPGTLASGGALPTALPDPVTVDKVTREISLSARRTDTPPVGPLVEDEAYGQFDLDEGTPFGLYEQREFLGSGFDVVRAFALNVGSTLTSPQPVAAPGAVPFSSTGFVWRYELRAEAVSDTGEYAMSADSRYRDYIKFTVNQSPFSINTLGTRMRFHELDMSTVADEDGVTDPDAYSRGSFELRHAKTGKIITSILDLRADETTSNNGEVKDSINRTIYLKPGTYAFEMDVSAHASVDEGGAAFALAIATSGSARVAFECAADVNCDGVVDALDVTDFYTHYVALDTEADIDTDGDVDAADETLFLAHYANGC